MIIPTHNGKKLIERCLLSLRSTTHPFSVTVVDDHSTDGTYDFLVRRFPWVKVIRNKRNLGPAASKNIGINETTSDLVATLDNDTVPTPTWLENLVKTMSKDSRIAACGSKLLILENGKVINSTGGLMTKTGRWWDRGLFEVDKGQYERDEEVMSVCTAAALFRRDILNQVGLFDEKLFYPLEDGDMGLRLNFAGYKVVYAHSSVVYHQVSGTMGRVNPRKTYLSERNRLRILLKNFGALTLVRRGPDLVRDAVEQILSCIFSKRDHPMRDRLFMFQVYARAILWNLLNLFDTLKEREKTTRMKRLPDSAIVSRAASRMPSLLFPDYPLQDRRSYEGANRRLSVIDFGKNDSLALGYGWHILEKSQVDPSVIFRWTSEEATAFAWLGDPSILKLEVYGVPKLLGRPLKGRVFVNESYLGSFEIIRDDWQVVYFRVNEPLGAVCEIKIQVKSPWFPCRVFKNKDPRLLGIGVRKIWFEKCTVD